MVWSIARRQDLMVRMYYGMRVCLPVYDNGQHKLKTPITRTRLQNSKEKEHPVEGKPSEETKRTSHSRLVHTAVVVIGDPFVTYRTVYFRVDSDLPRRCFLSGSVTPPR